MFDFFELGRVVLVQLPPVPQPRCLPRLNLLKPLGNPGWVDPPPREQPVGLIGRESRG